MRDFQEKFAKFFESPTREGLRELLEFNIGEQDCLDFKKEWVSFTKIARHILALANSQGGCIILGVSQNEDGTLESVGLSEIKDKAEATKSIESYIPNEVKYEIMDFTFSSSEYQKIVGMKFQVIFVDDNPEYTPFVSKRNGEGIRANAVYIRKGTSSEEASYEELQKLFNRRVDTNYSSTSELQLEEHLAQLKLLYKNIDKHHYVRKQKDGGLWWGEAFAKMITPLVGEKEEVLNPNYPEENFDQFINRIITAKKKKIERVLDLK